MRLTTMRLTTTTVVTVDGVMQGLVDEMTLLVCPVVVGQGTRLFPDVGPDAALALTTSRTTPSGVVVQGYRPAGRPRYETAAAEPRPSHPTRGVRP